MNMKLSYRDKVIFLVVVVIIVLGVGFAFFVRKAIQQTQDVNASLAIKQQEWDEVQAKIATLPDLKQELKKTVEEVDTLQKPYLDEQESYEADKYIYDILSKVDGFVSMKSMELTGEKEGNLAPYFYVRNSVAYDIKMSADLSGDSLPQEVYDKYLHAEVQGDPAVIVAVEEVHLVVNITDADPESNMNAFFAMMDAISKHDKTLYLRTIGQAEDEGSVTPDQEEAEEAEEGPKEAIDMVIDVFSIYHMDTSNVE
ncbi:MAG: hypothetical protein K6C13_13320 [Oscillospiraceae bacterium]|nr:hypothetical protein [Oscillospiraceae bacterium]